MKNITLIAFIVSGLLFSCGQVKKEIAGDQLLGNYSGKATFVYKHSLQNIGLEDEIKESKGNINVYKNSIGELFIKTGDGNLKLSGITLASNGTTFSIPYQNVVQQTGKTQLIQGFQVAELGGIKYDGIYNSENNILSFGYETVIKYRYWGTKADVSVICIYEFSKLN